MVATTTTTKSESKEENKTTPKNVNDVLPLVDATYQSSCNEASSFGTVKRK
jgi:hypothetical protein